jgi:hypothetical protein
VNVSAGASCITKLRLLFLSEKEAKSCALGLVAQIQPLAINVSHTATEIHDVAFQLYPTITACVTPNAVIPVTVVRCLSQAIGPVFSEVSKVAAKVKNEFHKYQEENSSFKTQLEQCGTELRNTEASMESLVQEVRQCVSEKELNASS